jgi:hypothetical protein
MARILGALGDAFKKGNSAIGLMDMRAGKWRQDRFSITTPSGPPRNHPDTISSLIIGVHS